MPKVKDTEILKAARENKSVTGRLPDGREVGVMGEEVRGLRSTNSPGVAQWFEHRPVNQRVPGSIPSQSTFP